MQWRYSLRPADDQQRAVGLRGKLNRLSSEAGPMVINLVSLVDIQSVSEVPDGTEFVVQLLGEWRFPATARFLGSVIFTLSSGCSVNLSNTRIPGNCLIRPSRSSGQIAFIDALCARVEGNLTVYGLKLGPASRAGTIDLTGTSIGGDLHFLQLQAEPEPHTEADGTVETRPDHKRPVDVLLDNSSVSQRACFEECKLNRVKAPLFRSLVVQFTKTTIRERLDLERAVVDDFIKVEPIDSERWGEIYMRYATLERGGVQVDAQRMHARRFDLAGASLRRKFEMKHAKLDEDFDGTSLRCDSSVDLTGLMAKKIKVAGAVVKGRVFHGEPWSDTPPQGEGAKAESVDARGAEIAELDLELHGALRQVDLSGANIHAIFLRGGDDALAEFKIKGLQFRELQIEHKVKEREFWSPGVWAWGAAFVAVACAAAFTGRGEWVLLVLAGYAAISFALRCRDCARAKSACAQGAEDARAIVGWLEDKCSKPKSFDKPFFVWVERWLRERGSDESADEVFLLRKKCEADAARLRGGFTSRDLLDRFLGFTLAYGARPGRLLHAYLLLWCFSWALFLDPHSVEHPTVVATLTNDQVDSAFREGQLVKSDGEALVRPTPLGSDVWNFDGSMPSDGEWLPVNALVVATRAQFPFASLGGESAWVPSSREIQAPWGRVHGVTYENLSGLLALLNLGLLPLLLAGLTGYLKRRA
jgi:hypothetical protein